MLKRMKKEIAVDMLYLAAGLILAHVIKIFM